MKIVSYLKEEHEQLAILVDDLVYDMETIHPDVPKYDQHVPELLG